MAQRAKDCFRTSILGSWAAWRGVPSGGFARGGLRSPSRRRDLEKQYVDPNVTTVQALKPDVIDRAQPRTVGNLLEILAALPGSLTLNDNAGAGEDFGKSCTAAV